MTKHIFNNRSAGSQDGDCDGEPFAGDDRLWRAWRYVSDEMDEGERSEFEQLLDESQELREAVAEAVELTQLVAVAEAEPVSVPVSVSTTPLWSRRLAWMVSGAAASLLLVIGLRFVPTLLAPATTHDPIGSGLQAELALAWSETRARMLADDADGDESRRASGDALLSALVAAEHESGDSGMVSPLSLADPMTSMTTPDWMMAALRAEAGEDAAPPEEGEEI